MKNFFIIVLLSWSFLTFAEAPQCTIENYKDIVFQENLEPPRCDLWQANLRGADLQGADLRGADMRMADLWGANLQNANLQGADLWHVHFWEVDLRGANLAHANLRGAHFSDANLRGVDLTQADFGFNTCRIANQEYCGPHFYGVRLDLTGAKVTAKQAEYLQKQDITGFEIVEGIKDYRL